MLLGWRTALDCDRAGGTNMAKMAKIILRKNKTDAVKRFHPWIFSGAIKAIADEVEEGDWVEVYSETGEYLATGFYNSSNIAVKVLSFQPVPDLQALLLHKLQAAYDLRQRLGFLRHPEQLTNCYRLVNAEGDGLPGLIIDWYDGVAVMQCYAIALYQQREWLTDCLRKLYGDQLIAVYDKSAAVLPKSVPSENQYLWGQAEPRQVLEYGQRFFVDWETGQKTGFFLDQRENRALLGRYVQDQRVLNTFCYSGGFSVFAVQAGASLVHSVDSSSRAIEWTHQNIALNSPTPNLPSTNQHEAFTEDVFDFLKRSQPQDYDVIVLDPPAFAKSLSARHSAMMAYKRLNRMAFEKVRSNGLIFTFSCSQVVGPDNFKGAVTAGAIEAGRSVQVLATMTQPADHPVSLYHPEGLYLKGLILRVLDA
ncbi:MAG: class I SAM-dependent rRNA methyltransferase [Synechococcales bacterium]|nr:class I SAM-dependent rRNA methyltransferase [Synechococcales bacterium]